MKEKEINFYYQGKKIASLKCEVAKTLSQKMKGLMYREKLDKNKGMYFPFYLPWIRTFWMKNVKIPLDIIFVNRKNKIINIYEAPVENKIFSKIYISKGFCKYVIETNKGFCREKNIQNNYKIKIH